jgi:hypothetical protein
MYRLKGAMWALVVAATACKAETQPASGHAEAAAGAPSDTTLIKGTPDGDLETWLGDMKSALTQVRDSLDANRAEAHKRVLDLYVSRQEYAEMYYGPGGRMQPEPALADAVKMNETRFHELMRLTGSVPPASADSIRLAVKALEDQIAVVETNAKRSARRVRSAP